MPCRASLFCSIRILKLPQRANSGGISVFLIQEPFAYMKKSSCGLTDVSMFFGSIVMELSSAFALADSVAALDPTVDGGLPSAGGFESLWTLGGGVPPATEDFCGSDCARNVMAQTRASRMKRLDLII